MRFECDVSQCKPERNDRSECYDARVNCPAENTWMRYVGGALEPASASAIEQHLDSCESCRFMFVNLAKGSANDASAARGP